MEKLNIHECWKPLFEKHKDLLDNIYKTTLEYELPIYPPTNLIYKVFEIDVKEIKILLLGQDPYHSVNQANGLAFSVNNNVKIPPSLKNIYKELNNTYPNTYQFNHGNLERWFNEEKIFLLNSSLTVLEGKPGIFMKKWQPFTDDVIKFINDNNKNCIFLLLGNFAKEKSKFINNKDRIIAGVHPSPLSANRGFLGSKIFKIIDEKIGYQINWSI
jgi:uracil-DNA glycosylase